MFGSSGESVGELAWAAATPAWNRPLKGRLPRDLPPRVLTFAKAASGGPVVSPGGANHGGAVPSHRGHPQVDRRHAFPFPTQAPRSATWGLPAHVNGVSGDGPAQGWRTSLTGTSSSPRRSPNFRVARLPDGARPITGRKPTSRSRSVSVRNEANLRVGDQPDGTAAECCPALSELTSGKSGFVMRRLLHAVVRRFHRHSSATSR